MLLSKNISMVNCYWWSSSQCTRLSSQRSHLRYLSVHTLWTEWPAALFKSVRIGVSHREGSMMLLFKMSIGTRFLWARELLVLIRHELTLILLDSGLIIFKMFLHLKAHLFVDELCISKRAQEISWSRWNFSDGDTRQCLIFPMLWVELIIFREWNWLLGQ